MYTVGVNKSLSPEEKERYSRQLMISDWGEPAQQSLKESRIGILGAGGLGSPVSLYLAAAGVGSISVCDFQELELSNLNRQILYTEDELGKGKAESAAERLQQLNTDIVITYRSERVDEGNVAGIFAACDLVIDCLDNFEARLVLNRFCWRERIPLLHAGISEYYGQLFLMVPTETACLACLLPEPEQNRPPEPVCGATAGVIGSMQAMIAIKYLAGVGSTQAGVLSLVDLNTLQLDNMPIRPREGCPVCGGRLL